MRKIIFLLLIALRAQAQTDSLDIKIGQMLLVGFPASAVDPGVLDDVRTGKAGSILLFEKNVPAANSYVRLKKIIQTYQQAAPFLLLIGIDQEGGKVNRLKEKYGFPKSMSSAALAKMQSLDSVRFYSECTAATLAGLGININFAPCVDLNVNPNNPVIAKKERAYSADADSVTMMANEVVNAHHRCNVLTALKHFPGHGSSNDDTHLGLTDVTKTWSKEELKPYQQLIDDGTIDAVMTSHIVNRQLDKEGYPGTLSAKIINGLLRNKMNYRGVVFTDDMQMRAITGYYGLREAIRYAIHAGVDILCFSNNISGSKTRTADSVHALIKTMVLNGEVPRERIEESFKRVVALKKKLINNSTEQLSKTVKEQQQIMAQQKAKLDEMTAALENVVPAKKENTKEKKKKRKKSF
ncbi:MAG: b-N-acetylglucosaminidase [Candidatus Nephrothrix sp. EaCA]|nr:MAG: b-N-acetylglucosaminidase [Candidatus Nephrothrix sp. EaCA]